MGECEDREISPLTGFEPATAESCTLFLVQGTALVWYKRCVGGLYFLQQHQQQQQLNLIIRVIQMSNQRKYLHTGLCYYNLTFTEETVTESRPAKFVCVLEVWSLCQIHIVALWLKTFYRNDSQNGVFKIYKCAFTRFSKRSQYNVTDIMLKIFLM